MKNLILLITVTFIALAGCSQSEAPPAEPAPKATAEVAAGPTPEEATAIAELQIFQRDLEALGNIYRNTESEPVKEAVIRLREAEILRLAGEADTPRERYEVKNATELFDSPKARSTVFQL